MRDIYLSAIGELCNLLDLQPAGFSCDTGAPLAAAIELQGVPFTLVHTSERAYLLSAYCSFGALSDDSIPSLRHLLEINLALARLGNGVLGLDGDMLIYAFKLPLQGLSGHSLHESLSLVASQADEWRRNPIH